MNDRLLYNRTIINKLSEIIESYPDLRFGQILVNTDIIKVVPSDKQLLAEDPFYEEPKVMWDRMCNNKLCFNNEKLQNNFKLY